jgi:hypothetical protein
VFDPTIGRWQSKDPKSFDAGDTNLYRFVGNHPSYATDPSGLEEPYVGPSIEILNSHKDAGGLDYQIRKVSSSELDQLYAAGLLSQYAYIEAQDLLSLHSRVRVAISRRLRNGIRAIEGATRVNGAIEAAAGAVEAAEGVVLLVPTVGGSFVMVVHGLDHTQAGTRSMFTGIDQNTFVATGAEYVGEHGLGLNKESARSLGQLTEFGSDIVVPIAMIRSARIGMLNSQVDDLAPNRALLGSGGLDKIPYPRTQGLGASSTTAELLQSGAIPGVEGVVLNQRVVKFADIWAITEKTGIEFALTREGGQYILRSGSQTSVAIPRGVRPILHSHPVDPLTGARSVLPSRADINTLNNLWNLNPNGPRPVSQILIGPGETTIFRATGTQPIPAPKVRNR